MKKNFVKKLALGLAFTVAVGSVPTTNAAAAETTYPSFKSVTTKENRKALKVGQTKKYYTKDSTKWALKRINIGNDDVATARFSRTKKFIKVTGVTAGKTQVRAVFKNYKTKEVYKGALLHVEVTDSKKAVTAIDIVGADDFVTTVNTNYVLTTKMDGDASAKVEWTVAEENASITAEGIFVAKKAGKYNVTASVKNEDGTVVSDTQEITVKTVVLQSVAQTKAAELKAAFTGDTSSIKREDITVQNIATKAILPVKSVVISKTNPNEVTVITFAGMTDGNEYTVTYDGVSSSFIATDGKIVGLGIDPVVITKATETVIMGQLLDVNGVVVNEFKYLEQPAKVDFNITTTKGYTTTDSKLYLNEIGDTATAKLTYHTYNWDNQGNEIGKIEKEFTITAVADATVVDDFKYTISSSATAPNWSTLAETNNKITIEDVTQQYVHFKFVDSNGVNVTNKYTVESSDTSKMLISENLTTGSSIRVTAVSEGTAYILVKNSDGQVVKYLPVTVVAARKAVRLSVDKNAVILSSNNRASDAITVTATMYDQYGDKRDASTIATAPRLTLVSKHAVTPTVAAPTVNVANGKVTVVFDASTAGWVDGTTYTFKLDASDIKGYTVSQIITVTYRTAAANGTEFAVELGGVEANNTVDVFVADGTTTSDYITGLNLGIKVVEKANGAFVGNCTLTNVNVTNPIGVTTAAAISGSTATYSLTTVSGSSLVVKNVMDGTYKVTIDYTYVDGNGNTHNPTATAYFTVTGVEKQAKPAVEYVHDGEVVTLDSTFTTVTQALQDSTKVIKFVYGDIAIPASDITVDSRDVVINGNDAYVKYATVNVPVSTGATGLKVQVKVPLNKTFTFDVNVNGTGVPGI